jgi:hypothetical protein
VEVGVALLRGADTSCVQEVASVDSSATVFAGAGAAGTTCARAVTSPSDSAARAPIKTLPVALAAPRPMASDRDRGERFRKHGLHVSTKNWPVEVHGQRCGYRQLGQLRSFREATGYFTRGNVRLTDVGLTPGLERLAA